MLLDHLTSVTCQVYFETSHHSEDIYSSLSMDDRPAHVLVQIVQAFGGTHYIGGVCFAEPDIATSRDLEPEVRVEGSTLEETARKLEPLLLERFPELQTLLYPSSPKTALERILED